MSEKSSKKEFIIKANKIHGNKYNYTNFKYIGNKIKGTIICKIHGEFQQNPNNHLTGYGCKRCGSIKTGDKLRDTIMSFIKLSNKIHNFKYDYSLVEYINRKIKIKIICPRHGVFIQSPDVHKQGHGCPKCSGIRDRNGFVDKSNITHNYKYDYSLVKYNLSKYKVIIICPLHGKFKQLPSNHMRGVGCPRCIIKGTLKNTSIFIEESKSVHGNRYDYSLVNYINGNKKVKIICRQHGEFEQKPSSHIAGSNCRKCTNKKRSNIIEFSSKANNLHNNKYDYSKFIYLGDGIKGIIICRKHGEFLQTPNAHLHRQGCPTCCESQGEKTIREYLESNKIQYIPQKTFPGCKRISKTQRTRLMPFDFYLSKYNLCIEYDGEQHFRAVCFKGMLKSKSSEQHKKTKRNDKIKNKYCSDNNIKLLRIPYTEFKNIEKILKTYLKLK